MSYTTISTIITCLNHRYNLLTRLAHLPPFLLLRPPSTGWTDAELAVDILRAFGRSEAVIELLRHLPYLPHMNGVGIYEVWMYDT
jgi:hypothetical protein